MRAALLHAGWGGHPHVDARHMRARVATRTGGRAHPLGGGGRRGAGEKLARPRRRLLALVSVITRTAHSKALTVQAARVTMLDAPARPRPPPARGPARGPCAASARRAASEDVPPVQRVARRRLRRRAVAPPQALRASVGPRSRGRRPLDWEAAVGAGRAQGPRLPAVRVRDFEAAVVRPGRRNRRRGHSRPWSDLAGMLGGATSVPMSDVLYGAVVNLAVACSACSAC
jgi:hypothetical protein